MLTAPPFAMTPEAADYVRSRLQEQEADRKPCLVRGFGCADGLSDVVYYEGEHFQIIHQEDSVGRIEHIELFGHQVTIARDTFRRLANRVLMLHTLPLPSGATKYVLLSP